MFEIKAIVRPERQDAVINALHRLPDLPGVIVSLVSGVGRRQSGNEPQSTDFGSAPMVKIEIVVAEDRLAEVLDAVERAGHTGRPGDGKVFVIRVEQALRLRTGETGVAAVR